MTHKKENSVPLPGVWRTIAAGFDLTSKHLWLLVLPVVLDTFLWLGPRLSGRILIERLVALLPSDQAVADLSAQLLALAPRTNLFTAADADFGDGQRRVVAGLVFAVYSGRYTVNGRLLYPDRP